MSPNRINKLLRNNPGLTEAGFDRICAAQLKARVERRAEMSESPATFWFTVLAMDAVRRLAAGTGTRRLARQARARPGAAAATHSTPAGQPQPQPTRPGQARPEASAPLPQPAASPSLL
jgi:hypothetical protein